MSKKVEGQARKSAKKQADEDKERGKISQKEDASWEKVLTSINILRVVNQPQSKTMLKKRYFFFFKPSKAISQSQRKACFGCTSSSGRQSHLVGKEDC
jgi:hypothetical protein